MTDDPSAKPPRITSVEIGPRTRALCWVFGVALVSAGGVAAFVSDNQAGTTALVLFGGLLLFIAITQRVPLLIEVGTAKLDTSYYEASDSVFEAGRDAAAPEPEIEPASPDLTVSESDRRRVLGSLYRGAVAARAAGITYRQLDYWARTELVTPTTGDDEVGGRRFSGNTVVLLRLVKELLDSGLSLQQIRQIIETLRPVDLAGLRGMYLVHDRNAIQITAEIKSTDFALPSTVVRLDPAVDRVVQTLAAFDPTTDTEGKQR